MLHTYSNVGDTLLLVYTCRAHQGQELWRYWWPYVEDHAGGAVVTVFSYPDQLYLSLWS